MIVEYNHQHYLIDPEMMQLCAKVDRLMQEFESQGKPPESVREVMADLAAGSGYAVEQVELCYLLIMREVHGIDVLGETAARH